ncbi:unnamed protein product [Peronospora belbahrii]|uniref:Uncharacterized protein n=1 Tax=Peronospora belbahrii TaxID=622444 RepID=A0ABN8D137_9STRA|nr:unnamed protein product [Peronospora belbahrii]
MPQEWATLVVALELVVTLCTSFWLVARQYGQRNRHPLFIGHATLLHPRGCWSLRALLAYRAVAATFFLVVQIWDVWRSTGRCLAMYTSWNFILQVWSILYPYAVKTGHPEKILNGVSYCQHGINVLLLQIDFAATKHLVSSNALPLIMGWPSVYAVFAWIVHGTVVKGFWPYPFLDLETPWAPFWYGGLLAAHIMALLLVMLLSKVKQMEPRSVTLADQVEA